MGQAINQLSKEDKLKLMKFMTSRGIDLQSSGGMDEKQKTRLLESFRNFQRLEAGSLAEPLEEVKESKRLNESSTSTWSTVLKVVAYILSPAWLFDAVALVMGKSAPILNQLLNRFNYKGNRPTVRYLNQEGYQDACDAGYSDAYEAAFDNAYTIGGKDCFWSRAYKGNNYNNEGCWPTPNKGLIALGYVLSPSAWLFDAVALVMGQGAPALKLFTRPNYYNGTEYEKACIAACKTGYYAGYLDSNEGTAPSDYNQGHSDSTGQNVTSLPVPKTLVKQSKASAEKQQKHIEEMRSRQADRRDGDDTVRRAVVVPSTQKFRQ